MSTAIRLLHGNFGRVALLRMNTPLVIHAHHHCHILIKASGSDAAFNVNGTHVPLTERNAVLVNAWEPHAFISSGCTQQHTVVLALYVEPSWLGQHSPRYLEASYSKFFSQPAAQLSPSQINLINKIISDLWLSNELDHLPLEVLLAELCLSFLHESGGPFRTYSQHYSQGKTFMDPRIRMAIARLNEAGSLPADISTLASSVQLSRSRFFELFRGCTGLSPVLYINTLKMERAFQALAAHDRSLEQISYDLGFSAQGHFSRFFRQHQGVLPSHYRRNLEFGHSRNSING
ncbi:MAG: helix-turn-helix domain-containing protein [Burkholderiaceae bacterium]